MKNLPARIEKLESAAGGDCVILFFFIGEDGSIEHKGEKITPEEYATLSEGATDVINFIDPPRNNPYTKR
jgi:hypothetical protein